MTDFYEPTLLFRQNAIRRSPYNSPSSSGSSLVLPEYKSKNASWIFNNSGKDTEVLNKVCSLDRLNIKSNYWKIPDTQMNLTSMATKSNDNMGTLAISSGNKSSNLFIYQLDLEQNYLTHHNTVSLPNIHAMKWVPNNSNLLMTGNNKGYGHLITVPLPNDEESESAEILKRFNHRKHLRSINKDPSIFQHNSTIIEKMSFIDSEQLISIYDDNLFNWDLNDNTSSAKPKPTSITSINGLQNFDKSHNNNILGISGKFGVSIFDLRDPKFNIPNGSNLVKNKSSLRSNLIKWSPTDEHVFAASHLDGVIRLWDIRKQDYFGKLEGHQGRVINTMEWVDGDLFSGGKDGNIIHWDLTNDITGEYDLMNCGLKEGLRSIKFDPQTNREEQIINQRQCGTILPASNTNIISLESIETSDDLKVLSIDGSSFFGLHSRIYDAVDFTDIKTHYTHEDIELIKSSEKSNSTLVEDEPAIADNLDVISVHSYESIKPLDISRKPTIAYNSNDSHETLLDTPIEPSKFDVDFTDLTDISVTELHSPDSVKSRNSFDSVDSAADSVNTVATSIHQEEITGKDDFFTPGHKYQLSEVTFDDDLVFNNSLMSRLAI